MYKAHHEILQSVWFPEHSVEKAGAGENLHMHLEPLIKQLIVKWSSKIRTFIE